MTRGAGEGGEGSRGQTWANHLGATAEPLAKSGRPGKAFYKGMVAAVVK